MGVRGIGRNVVRVVMDGAEVQVEEGSKRT
jgi:hypothetical protein